MSLLVGCQEYVCNEIMRPIEGSSVAPFVKLFFCNEGGGEPVITVGNKSSPQWDNTAIIKTFQIGGSNGIGVRIEIMDEMGGSFHLFIEKLNKCIGQSKSGYTMGVQWGWIITDCIGGNSIKASPNIYVIPINLEVIFSDGRIKFVIEGQDSMQHVFTSRHDEIEGTDDKKTSLKEAIKSLGENKDPKIDIKFIRIEKDGTITEFPFRHGGMQGPKSVWPSDGQNKLATIQKWCEPFMTDRNKGLVAMWNPTVCGNPTLDLMEDPKVDCNESRGCNGNLGTYIVNGGKHSPVLSFTPTINYVESFAGLTTGGNAPTTESGKPVEVKHKCQVQKEETGVLQSVPVSKQSRDAIGTKTNLQETAKSQSAYARANTAKGPITAELRIQGEPRQEFIHPKLMLDKFVSLIVINPFHIFGSGNGGCGDWLAQPGCNEVLSNKDWMITGCSHDIKEGSYVTTLQLKLVAPGVEINAHQPFGGPGSGGYVPTNDC